MSSDAAKVKTKTSVVIAGLNRVLADDLSPQLPPANANAARSILSELKAYEEEAKHASDGLQDELSFTMDQLDQHVKLAKKELQLLDGFLAALRKHSA